MAANEDLLDQYPADGPWHQKAAEAIDRDHGLQPRLPDEELDVFGEEATSRRRCSRQCCGRNHGTSTSNELPPRNAHGRRDS